jgi:hypothetical protein
LEIPSLITPPLLVKNFYWYVVFFYYFSGILFGLITLLVQYVGLFMLGFHGGLIIGILILCTIELVDPLQSPESPWVSLLILLFFGLVMALCNLYLQVRQFFYYRVNPNWHELRKQEKCSPVFSAT